MISHDPTYLLAMTGIGQGVTIVAAIAAGYQAVRGLGRLATRLRTLHAAKATRACLPNWATGMGDA
jgi:hypothetical protein